MYKIIDDQEDAKLQNQAAQRITPQMLGLKPTTDFAQFAQQKIIDANPEKAKTWGVKGGIDIMEAGRRFADDFNGNYDNLDDNANLNPIENKMKNSRLSQNRSGTVDARIAKNKQDQEDRKMRINNGTASIFDKISNTLDKFGENSYNAQVDYAKQNEDRQKPHKNDSNYRYEAKGTDRTGNVIYNEVDLRKKIGFLEGLSNSVESGESLPFIGGYIEGKGKQRVREIKSKIEKNEPIRKDELDYLNKYIDRQQEEYVRGYTIGGQIGESWLPSLLAFGAEIALGGAVLKGVGLAGKGLKVGNAVTSGLSAMNKAGKVGEGVAKGAGFAVGQIAEAGITAGVTEAVNPFRLYATYQERRLNDEIKITDRGTAIFSEAKETPARAFFKSLGKVYVSYFTESMGELIGGALIKPVGKAAGKITSAGAVQFAKVMENTPQLAKLIKRTSPVFARVYEKMNNLPLDGKAADWLKSQVKFDGFLEECGEEVLEDVLNLAIGSDYEERSLDNYVKSVFKTPEEWAVIAGTIALQGGAISLAGNLLGDHMQRSGVPEEDILKVLTNSTENEKNEMIDELIENGSINLKEDVIGQDLFDAVSESHKNSLIEKGLDDKKAEFATSFLMTQLEQLSKKTGISIDELYEKEAPEIINKEQEKLDYYESLAGQYSQVDNADVYYQQEGYREDRKNLIADKYNDQVKFYNGEWIHKNVLAEKGIDFDKSEIGDYVDFFEESNKKELLEYNQELDKIAKKHFGTTTDINEAGYILNDGSLLDFSGKRDGGTPHKRGYDHREISSAFDETEHDVGFDEFIDNGAVRFMPESNSFFIARMPSEKQFAKMKKIIESKNGEVYLELTPSVSDWGRNNNFKKEYVKWSQSDKILDDIKTYFSGGKVSEFKKYYQPENGEQQNIFPGNRDATKLRNVKGAYIPAENLIELFKSADESTIIHEYAHWYLSRMEKFSENSDELKEDLEAVRKFVKNGGEPFTKEQHEKFARGFEAYIRSGNARNNRLKKIFEDFKNALLSIYDEITKIIYSEEGVDKPFTEEDLPQIENLFNRLMSTENERIQRTVFDRCDEVDEQIKKIRENQDQEFAELDKLYADNIDALNRKSDKRRQVDEYLDLANKAVSREPKELKEFKQRYKDVTLSILEKATGYDRRFISNSRNWEKVQEKIGNIDDPFSSSDGMLPEWTEFYGDTGVSYDNQEVGGDYDLASKAFDVLAEGNYSYGDFQYKDIEDFTGKFDYLYGKVLSLKGEEKSTALEALYSLFSDMPSMPDEVTSDLIEKLQDVGDVYEDQQKEDFNRKRYPNIPVVQQLQFFVTNKLRDMKVYNPETRYKMRMDKSHRLYSLIKNATSVNSTKKIIRTINQYVIDDLQGQQRRILHKEIQKQIKVNSRLVKTGSIRHGKFDWRTNTIFAELSEINKLKSEEALKEYINFTQADSAFLGEEREDWKENAIETGDVSTDFQDILKRKFLEYRSLKIPELNVLHTRSVLEDIMTLKFEGRRAKSEEELKKKLNKFDFENNLIQILKDHQNNKIAKAGTKWIVNSSTLVNWESTLNALFDAETADKYSLLGLEAQAEVYARDKYLFFLNKVANIYGFKAPNAFTKALDFDNIQPLIDLFKEYENETYTYKETTFNRDTGKYVETNTELTKAQIITLFTWSLNSELEQRISTQYGVTQWLDMQSKLSPQDQQLCWALIEACDNMYEDTNEVFIRTLGLSLPRVENYFPSKTERIGSDLDLFHDFMAKSNNPSFIKQRKKCKRIKMSPQSPLAILLPHLNKTARYVILSETVNFYNKVFQSGDLKAVITESYGKKDGDKIHRVLLNQLAASTFTTYARGVSMVGDVMDKISTNYITSKIGGSLKVMLGQLGAQVNYAEIMPAHEWAAGWAKAWKNPVKTFKYMIKNCKYLKARLAGNTQNEIIATLTSESDKFRTLKNFCTLNVRWGDIISITLGGKPYVDYLIKQGLDETVAFDKFVEETLRAQQAGLNSATSEWQKAQAKTALGRMFFAFRNTDIQYERKYVDSLIKFSKGDIDGKQLFKTIAIYKILNPVMFLSFLQNMSILALFRALMGGDDPDKTWGDFVKDILMSIGLSGLNAYGLAGFLANSFIQAMYAAINKKILDDDYKVFNSSVPVLTEFEDVLRKTLIKEDPELSDWVDAVSFVGDNATGAPVTKTVNIVGGVGDAFRGEVGIGTSRMAGWGNYIATEAWTGKAPKKRRKRRMKYE